MKIDKIHSDDRGFIFAITGEPLTLPEVSFLSTKAGIARGGCIHYKNTEHLCVIEGTIEYYLRLANETETRKVVLTAGQSVSIPPATPHYLISISDSVVMEWGCEISEKKDKHEEFRKIVMEINKK